MTPSSSIAHYRIVSKLGEGGMGAVYRATDTKLNRDVAIKVLPDSFAQDADRLARFTREAQVLASLNHSNIAVIHGVEERAIVMELVEGATLAGPLPLEEALPQIHQLIDALEYAHEKGIVHRDLKPANIKVTPEGRLKVLDFGLAKAMSDDTPAANPASSPTLTMRATQAGMIMGTAAYMAPEQARGHRVDKRADIWAFGVVVYEMLTGRQLFAADTVSDILAQVLTKEPDLAAVPARFRPLLRRCLERDPRKRLRDIGDARAILEEPEAAPAPAQAARRPWIWIAATVAFVLSTCAFAWLWMRTGPVPTPLYRFAVDTSVFHLSPNGRWILNLRRGLTVRSMDGLAWRLLPGTETATDPFWSPDSSMIGFFAEGRLRTVSVDGSNPRNLAAAGDAAGGTWRGGVADGTILFASAGSFHALDLSSGNLRALPLKVSAGELATYPTFLPEGDGFVYLAGSETPKLFRSSLASTNSSGEHLLDTGRRVTFARHPRTGQWHIFYIGSDDLTLFVRPVHPRTGSLQGQPVRLLDSISRLAARNYSSFDVAESGAIAWRTGYQAVWRLRWYDRKGNITGTIGDAAMYSSLALAPDETRVAVCQGFPTEHIWIYNLQTGAGANVSSVPGRHGNPVWSPDSRMLYYAARTESGHRVIRQEALSGSPPEVLFEDSRLAQLSLQEITPDGRHLLLIRRGIGPDSGVQRLDLSAPAPRKLEQLLPDQAANVRVLPDGHSMMVDRGRTIYASSYPVSGEPPRQIAEGAGINPFLGRDGRQLYLVAGQSLVSHPVLPVPGGGIRLGQRTVLFPIVTPTRVGANVGAQTRDGRLLIISTDPDNEELKTSVLSDWTILLKP